MVARQAETAVTARRMNPPVGPLMHRPKIGKEREAVPSLPPRSNERRSWPRTRQHLRVLVTDLEDALEEPYIGWIVNHSPAGVCLSFDGSRVEMSNVMIVQTSATGAQVEVRVTNLRRNEGRVEVGCEFVQPDVDMNVFIEQRKDLSA